MKSCLYVGSLRHRRFAPRPHAFRYTLFMVYLDLGEIDQVFRGRWFWSASRFALARWRRADYLGDAAVPLDRAVRDRVESETGRRPGGPIRMLTHLRYFGVCFNPVTFYYCFDAEDRRLETIVAEITNTPWNERHAYVLDVARHADAQGASHHSFRKRFHVSPFMAMTQTYDWRFSAPSNRLGVHMRSLEMGAKVFDATLDLERRAISTASLMGVLVRFPLMTVKVIAAIYWQALRLWLKREPFHAHPGKTMPAEPIDTIPGR